MIILPIQIDRMLFLSSGYRLGVGQINFRLSRWQISKGQSLIETAIAELLPLNPQDWAVNSFFPNQKPDSFIAHIHESQSAFL